MKENVSILVVDDSPAICRSIVDVLTGAGYHTTAVHSGLDAISTVKQKKYDLITLDVEMPGMAGIDVLRILKAYDPDLFVIMVSGLSALQTALQAIRQGAYDYINKPFDPEDMLLSVQRALKQRELVLENRRLIRDLKSLNENLEELVRQRTEALARSEQKLMEYARQLEAANRELKELDQMKAKFISIASHELKTPLTTIRGYAGLLASNRLNTPEKQARAFQGLERNIERLTAIVTQITDISRLREKRVYFKKQPVSLFSIVEDVVQEIQPFIEERNQKLEAKVSPHLPPIVVDPFRIQQVLSNLLLNAIRFTPDGGEISIFSSYEKDQGFLKVSVRDTGIGIPSEEIEKIFEEFYEAGSTDYHHSGTIEFRSGGMGLGLSVVKTIVEEHGGRIWAESDGKSGSTFHFLLPVDQKKNQ